MAAIPDRTAPTRAIVYDLEIETDEGRHKLIEVAAYFKAEKRGFAPGHELDDWLEAEQELEEALKPLPSY